METVVLLGLHAVEGDLHLLDIRSQVLHAALFVVVCCAGCHLVRARLGSLLHEVHLALVLARYRSVVVEFVRHVPALQRAFGILIEDYSCFAVNFGASERLEPLGTGETHVLSKNWTVDRPVSQLTVFGIRLPFDIIGPLLFLQVLHDLVLP